MTRIGRIFAAPELPVRSEDPKGKAKANVVESDKADEVSIGRFSKEEDEFS